MSAIFGYTFDIGRMTEVLTPDIYIELTAINLTFHKSPGQGHWALASFPRLLLSLKSLNNKSEILNVIFSHHGLKEYIVFYTILEAKLR